MIPQQRCPVIRTVGFFHLGLFQFRFLFWKFMKKSAYSENYQLKKYELNIKKDLVLM